MILISNPRAESLQQLLPLIQAQYPAATIKKVFLSPEAIFVPQPGFKFVIRKVKTGLKIDHTLPVLWAIGAVVISSLIASVLLSLIYGQFAFGFGGALWIILGVFLMKIVFRSVRKEQFESFKTSISSLVSGFDFDKQPLADW